MKFPVKRVIITLLIYILSLAAGAALIIMLVYNEHRDIVRNMAANFAAQFDETGSFDDIDLHAFGLLIYDSEGKCISSKKISSVINDYGISDETVYPTSPEGSAVSYPYIVPDNCVFVLNDYRSDLSDSRTFGGIPSEELRGAVVFTMRMREI